MPLPGMDLRASSLMSFVPWVVMAVGSTCAGLLADGLVRLAPPLLVDFACAIQPLRRVTCALQPCCCVSPGGPFLSLFSRPDWAS